MIKPDTSLGRNRRRVIALGLMLALGVSAMEAVAGPSRDGSMHHESNVEAASHRSALGVRHDHDDGSRESPPAGPTSEWDSLDPVTTSQPTFASPAGETEHEHPGGDDHCAHVHGVALVPTVALTFSAIVVDAPIIVTVRHDDPSTVSVRRPPRA